MKNRKVIFIVLCVILVLLIGIGVWSFISYSNNKGYNEFDYKPTIENPTDGDPYVDGVAIYSSEEFIEYIKANYYDHDDTNDCYKAVGPDGVNYSFCLGAQEVSIEK